MNPNDQNPNPGAGTGGGVITPALPPEIQAEIDQLRQYRDQAESTFAQLRPHKTLVEKVLADESYRKRAERLAQDEESARFYDETLANYEAIRQRQAPQIPEALKPFDEKLNKVIEFNEKLSARQQQEDEQRAKSSAETQVREAIAIAQELEKKYPFIAYDNYAQVQQMALSAQQRGVPFKTVADEFTQRMSRYEASQRQSQPNAPTLRTQHGKAGVPAASEQQPPQNEPFFTTVVKKLNEQRKGA